MLECTMRNFFITLALLFLQIGSVVAGPIEWTAVHKTRVGRNAEVTGYAAEETIVKKGNLAKMWHLWDYKKPQGNPKEPFMSAANKSEFDCIKRNARVLMVVFYDGGMGSGAEDADDEEDPRAWLPADHDEMHSKLLNLACGKN